MDKKPGIMSSLRFQVTIWLTLLIIAIMMLVQLFVLNSERKVLTRELIKKGESMARNLALKSKEAYLSNDETIFITSIKDMMSEEEIIYVIITDKKGIIKASNNIAEQGGKQYQPPTDNKGLTDKEFTIKYFEMPMEGGVYDISLPVKNGDKELGMVYIGFSQKSIEEVVRDAAKKIAGIMFLVLVLGIIISLFLVNHIVTPIKMLVKGVLEIGKGNFDTQVDVKVKNELGELTNAFNDMAKSLKEKEMIKGAFSSYLSEEVLNDVLVQLKTGKLKLGGEKMRVSILFSDIRGFTSMSEKLSAEDVVHILNEYFDNMTEIVQANKGMVNKFIGDAVMAIFGAPVRVENSSFMAVKSAVEMHAKLKELNEKFKKEKGIAFNIGVGINIGEVIVGNIGSHKHLEYTVIGDAVNVASRLESLNKQYKTGVIVSEDSYNEVASLVEAKDLGLANVPGKQKPIHIYEITGIK